MVLAPRPKDGAAVEVAPNPKEGAAVEVVPKPKAGAAAVDVVVAPKPNAGAVGHLLSSYKWDEINIRSKILRVLSNLLFLNLTL